MSQEDDNPFAPIMTWMEKVSNTFTVICKDMNTMCNDTTELKREVQALSARLKALEERLPVDTLPPARPPQPAQDPEKIRRILGDIRKGVAVPGVEPDTPHRGG